MILAILFAAAADADAEDNSLDDTDENRSQAWIVETVYLKESATLKDATRLNPTIVSQNHENSIENTQPSFFQNGFNIVGRTAVATSVLGTAFVDLCQRTSTNAVALPRIAVIHIQKIAPGPPKQMAVEMPAIFPVPTREAVETINA